MEKPKIAIATNFPLPNGFDIADLQPFQFPLDEYN